MPAVLPAFIGAGRYAKAGECGVKLIGATAQWHGEDRVIRDGKHTIVFARGARAIVSGPAARPGIARPAQAGQTVGMPDLPVRHFPGRDGTRLAYREMGQGRPVVLIHGYFSNATVNWVTYGHAATVAARGFRVILPDLRGHGDSAKPQDAAAYPPDILADDGFALIEHLGLASYALGGYSLGARTTIRMLVRGAAPSRAVVAGMGLDGVLHASGRNAHFRRILTQLGTFDRRSPEGKAEAFLKNTGADPVAMLQLLDSGVDMPPGALAKIGMPVLVVAGAEDDDNGSAEALAAALPRGQAARIPGNHMSAVARPELGAVIAGFLAEEAEEGAR